MSITPSIGVSVAKIHENITENFKDLDCNSCHPVLGKQRELHQENNKFLTEKSPVADSKSIAQVDSNFSVQLTFGQTPYQLGPFFLGEGLTGYSWWDVADSQGEYSFGTEIQKNLISLMILDNSTGTTKPVIGLVTPPVFPQVTRRNHSASHSYKADIDDEENNYPNNVDIWMIKEINLTELTNAKLSFWTWYAIETDWDYGYVMISTDNGNSWRNLQGTLTRNSNPNGENLGNGITGTSSGWIQETMDLNPFVGNKSIIAFRFISDAGTNGEGWYIDDINITSSTNSIFSDDAEIPFTKRMMSVNVTYPHLTLINKTNPLTGATTLFDEKHTQQVELKEDIRHPGTYAGYFLYNVYDEFYSGNYSIDLDFIINNTHVSASTGFQTTLFGCNNCHNKNTDSNGVNTETSFIHSSSSATRFCAFTCHSGSRGFFWQPEYAWAPPIRANPMHVHEMQFGHRRGFQTYALPITTEYDVPAHVPTVSCVQCHTNFIHDNNNTDTATIASYTLYGTNISYSSGTHVNLTCEECHGTLEFPSIPPEQFQMQGELGAYRPDFTSHEAFTDTYIIDVDGMRNLNITITGEETKKTISLYTVGPVNNTSTGLMGPCPGGDLCEIIQSLETPLNLNIPSPYMGTWIAKIIQKQEGSINYTISSSYPIQKKSIIRIPECNICHNLNGERRAYTTDLISDWNPGFAHIDTNGDGALDIQCRMCHDSMHNIVIKPCQNCHTTAPINHPISDPAFAQYNITQCLACHGDPHRVTLTGGTDCIGCHATGVNIDVNISLFGGHAKINDSNGAGDVTNDDCWTCHYQKDMDKNHVYLCGSCHSNNDGIVKIENNSLVMNDFMHDSTECRTCHAPIVSGYHLNGTVGPLGTVEKILRKIQNLN